MSVPTRAPSRRLISAANRPRRAESSWTHSPGSEFTRSVVPRSPAGFECAADSAPTTSAHISTIIASCAARSTPQAAAAERRIALREVSALCLNSPSSDAIHRCPCEHRWQGGEGRYGQKNLRPTCAREQLHLAARIECHDDVI